LNDLASFVAYTIVFIDLSVNRSNKAVTVKTRVLLVLLVVVFVFCVESDVKELDTFL
jgi:hypothetical protein